MSDTLRSRKDIEGQMMDCGFEIWSIINGTDVQGIDSSGINLIVQPDETFTLKYMIPKSVAYVTLGPCRPFSSHAHFHKMLTKMRGIVADLSYRNAL